MDSHGRGASWCISAPAESAMELSLSSSGFTVVKKQVAVVFKPVSLLLVLMTFSVMNWSALAHAQFNFSNAKLLPARFVGLPRILQKQIREAEEAIADSRFNDAVLSLGDLLARVAEQGNEDDLLSQDFFLDVDEARVAGAPLNKSFKVKVRDMIGALPLRALETYEIRYGPAAVKMLDEAASTRDWSKVREVRRRYFHTPAGYDASWLLAQHEMLEGHPIAASTLLDDIVTVPRAVNRLGKGVLVLHAAACKLANRKLPAELVGISGQSGQVRVAGVEQSGPEDGELSSWLEQFYGSTEKLAAGQLEDYRVFNASESRNGASSGQMPLSNLRWQLDTTVSPKQQREVKELSKSLGATGQMPPPSWMPLRVGDQLLMRTTEYLVGVDYRTGKRVWLHPWSKTADEDETTPANLGMMSSVKKPSGLTEFLRQRVWNDVPYGQVTSDGERVYLLEGLRKLNMQAFPPMRFPQGGLTQSTGNSLVALELASEGILKWFQGARAGPESPLANAFFLGPPLPIEGRLYAMCELAGDIFVICLDPDTGKEIWRQQLVAVESGTIDRDAIRRVAGAMLSYQDGFLVCPTGAGALVALNLGDRTLRWGINYERNTTMSRFVQGRGVVNTDQLLQRWFTGTAIISDSSVLITPVESDRLFGLDLITGRALFTKKVRLEMRYLAGIRGDKFYVVGTNVMKAYTLDDGSLAWKTALDVFLPGQQVAGQGVFGEESYLLPTNTQEIIRISLKDGSEMERRATNYELGNMIAVDGEIITQGPTKLSVAFGEGTLVPLVERMLEEDPDNFDAIVRKSELLIQSGDVTEALKLLEKARRAQPENDEVRMLSVSGMFEKFRESGTFTASQAEELAKLIDRPIQQIEFNALRFDAAIAAKDDKLVASLLLDLSELIVAEFKPDETAERVQGDMTRDCLMDAWLNGRVREYLTRVQPEAREYFEAQLKAHLVGKESGSSELIQRILTHFDGMDAAESLRKVLGERYLREKELGLVETNALGRFQSDLAGLQQLSIPRLLMLADAYQEGDMPRNTLSVVQEIDSRSEEVSEQDKKLVDIIRSEATQAVTPKEWPQNVSGQWNLESIQRRTRTTSSLITERPVLVSVQAGDQFRGWALVFVAGNQLRLRTPDGVLINVKLSGRRINPKRKVAFVSGGVMVVHTGEQLFAIDLYKVINPTDDPILWFHEIAGTAGNPLSLETSSTPFGDQVSNYRLKSNNMRERPEFRVGPVLGDRLLVLQGGELSAINLRTGENIWQTSAAPKSGVVLSDGERVAVVSSINKETVLFDIADGRKVGRLPFEYGELWRAVGDNVLCYQATDQEDVFTVKVVNPMTGKVLLSQEANSSDNPNEDSQANVFVSRVFSENYLAMMSPSGETFVWDLREARELVRTKLAPQEKLEKVRVIFLGDLAVLLPGYASPAADTSKPRVGTRHGDTHHTVNAAFAFSLKNGDLVWSKEFEKAWGCTTTQAMTTPAVVLARIDVTYEGAKEISKLEALALNAKTGNVLAVPEPRLVQNRNTRFMETAVIVNAAESKVNVTFGGAYALALDFKSDAEKPDAEKPDAEKPDAEKPDAE